jgi:transcription initiation factor TFIIB
LGSHIIEKTAYIYRKAEDRGLVRGRTTSGMVTAALYLACREIVVPRTLKEIAAVSNTKRKHIALCCRLLISGLDLKVPMAPHEMYCQNCNKAGF